MIIYACSPLLIAENIKYILYVIKDNILIVMAHRQMQTFKTFQNVHIHYNAPFYRNVWANADISF